MTEPTVTLTMSVKHAYAVSKATDLLARIGIGQLEQIAEMISSGDIPKRASESAMGVADRTVATTEECIEAAELVNRIKSLMGFSAGASLGIGHKHTTESVNLGWEVKKVLDKVLAEHRNPEPLFRGTNYDGLTVRYSNLPAPEAKITLAI